MCKIRVSTDQLFCAFRDRIIKHSRPTMQATGTSQQNLLSPCFSLSRFLSMIFLRHYNKILISFIKNVKSFCPLRYVKYCRCLHLSNSIVQYNSYPWLCGVPGTQLCHPRGPCRWAQVCFYNCHHFDTWQVRMLKLKVWSWCFSFASLVILIPFSASISSKRRLSLLALEHELEPLPNNDVSVFACFVWLQTCQCL